jgi:hypothetical protein
VLTFTNLVLYAISLILSVKELSMSSFKSLIALLEVCKRETMTAEYDTVRNRERRSTLMNAILDEELSGVLEVPETHTSV